MTIEEYLDAVRNAEGFLQGFVPEYFRMAVRAENWMKEQIRVDLTINNLWTSRILYLDVVPEYGPDVLLELETALWDGLNEKEKILLSHMTGRLDEKEWSLFLMAENSPPWFVPILDSFTFTGIKGEHEGIQLTQDFTVSFGEKILWLYGRPKPSRGRT